MGLYADSDYEAYASRDCPGSSGRVLDLLQSEQNTKLYRFYMKDANGAGAPPPPPRHRGKSPQQPAFFTRSARARHESAVLASLCRLVGALPGPATHMPGVTQPDRSLASLGRGELLCQAYESYRSLIGTPLISFEHAVFLLGALWRGEELVLSACRDCNAVLVADRWSIRAPRCGVCGASVVLRARSESNS